MSVYQTKPRRLILCFLQQHPNRSYTAEELANALAAESARKKRPEKARSTGWYPGWHRKI